jgi:hypothetical protein
VAGWDRGNDHHSFAWSVLKLLGHLIGTAIVFLTLFTLAWAIGFFCHRLNAIYPFADDTFTFIARIEKVILWGDTALCAVVLLNSMWRFCKDVMR